MTRKRFIKLLMSHGVSRNDANKAAREVAGGKISYKEQFELIAEDVRKVVDLSVSFLNEMLPSVVEAITAVIPQLIAEIERIRQETESATE